ncbi:MAG: serine hydrolase [Planctomycetota bacterium]|nr:serine hydrolase [Planctomycetota bacterium]
MPHHPRPRLLPSSLAVVLLVASAGLAPGAQAEELPRSKPAEVGLSATALDSIDGAIKRHIAKKDIAGAITVVARKGRVAYLRSFGAFADDSIVRIFSMTKPIAVVAALMLVDEGKLKLDDPVAKYIPAFGALSVQGEKAKAPPMTVQHLMQHTAGLTYGFFGNTQIDQRYRALKVLDKTTDLEAMTAKLGGVPLLFEPGTRWHYSVSIDVLGRVVEVAAKKPFDVFLQERIFKPLDMKDTAFHVPDEKLDRFVANYTGRAFPIEKPETSGYRQKPALSSGGGGLVSTARDYAIFALMLAQGGTWNGTRLLKEATVRRMTTNQLPKALVPIGFGPKPMAGMGFGLGVSVRVGAPSPSSKLGEWGWGGAASTTFFVAPRQDLVVVTMTQRMPMWNGLDRSVRPLAYGAVQTQAPAPKPEPEPAGAGK